MKKLLTLLLTAALATAAATTAFADDTTITADTNGNLNPTTGTTNVTYNVKPSYTVTIPANVTLGQTATVSASNVKIGKNQNLKVKLTGTSGANNAFTVQNGDEVLTYTVKKDNANITIGGEVLIVNTSTTSDALTAQLSFDTPTSVTYAGTYTGTVTFTVSVETTGGNN